eukprot:scaffold329922_cov17-Prasinocladus_malaysianus.AAC.2
MQDARGQGAWYAKKKTPPPYLCPRPSEGYQSGDSSLLVRARCVGISQSGVVFLLVLLDPMASPLLTSAKSEENLAFLV